MTNLDGESGVSSANISGLTTRGEISGEQAPSEGFWRVQVNSHGVDSAAEFHCGERRRWVNSLRWRRVGGLGGRGCCKMRIEKAEVSLFHGFIIFYFCLLVPPLP